MAPRWVTHTPSSMYAVLKFKSTSVMKSTVTVCSNRYMLVPGSVVAEKQMR